jgi:hypothetical protein
MKPNDISPSIFDISKRKNFTIKKGIHRDFWISNINTKGGITIR